MIISIAQTHPIPGNIGANIDDHCYYIEQAAEYGSDLILFPELSLTGYEREKAKIVAFNENDRKLAKLKKISKAKNIIIIAGAPIDLKNELFIGAFIIYPDDSISIYTKQYLHTGEEAFFSSSFEFNPIIKIKNERISLGICADIDKPVHPENAMKSGSTIYLASIFWGASSMKKAYNILATYAENFKLDIIMSNFVGNNYGMEAGGLSGAWNNTGDLLYNLNAVEPGLLVLEKNGKNWSCKKTLYMKSI